MLETTESVDQIDEDVTDLFYALTENRCRSYDDIGEATEWTNDKVARILVHIRQPEVAEEWGWTVPHVPRGRGDHWFQVVMIDGSPLDEEQRLFIKEGAISTLRHTEAMGLNEAHALRMAAKLAGPGTKHAQSLVRTAKALEGAAAMAGDMAEQLVMNGVR